MTAKLKMLGEVLMLIGGGVAAVALVTGKEVFPRVTFPNAPTWWWIFIVGLVLFNIHKLKKKPVA